MNAFRMMHLLLSLFVAASSSAPLHTTMLVEVQVLGRERFTTALLERQLAAVRQRGKRIGVVDAGDDDAATTTLDATQDFVFRVARAPSHLDDAVRQLVAAGGDRAASSPAVLARLETAAQHAASYTLYVLDYAEHAAVAAADAAPCGAPCGASTLGALGAARVMWIDLAASASQLPYGALGGGSNSHRTVDLRRALAAGADPKQPQPARLSASVAALIHRAARLLLAPPMQRFPVPLRSEIVVQVFSIAAEASLVGGDAARTAAARAARSEAWRTVERQLQAVAAPGQTIRVEVQHRALGACAACATALARATRTRRAIFAHAEKGGALSSSSSSSSSRHRLVERSQRYLEAAVLRDSLAALDAEHRSIVAVNAAAASGADLLVVPVFLFSLLPGEEEEEEEEGGRRREGRSKWTADAMLLDGEHLARRYADMIVAVQTPAAQSLRTASLKAASAGLAESGSCQGRRTRLAANASMHCGGQLVGIDARDARRATLAALLQHIWGVASTRVGWNSAQPEGAVQRDDLWSLSATPFGTLAGASADAAMQGQEQGRQDGDAKNWGGEWWTTFAQRDAAQRNVVLSELDAAMAPLRGEGRFDALAPSVRSALEHKLTRAASSLSLHDVERALHFARALRHDARVAAAVLPPPRVEETLAALEKQGRCHDHPRTLAVQPPHTLASLTLLGGTSALLGAAAYAALRRLRTPS